MFLWRRPRGLRGDNDIHEAAFCGSLGAVQHLLRTVPGAAAATDDEYGATALCWAARWGHAEICRVLLAAGAAVDARRWGGLLAEDCAAGWKTFLLGGENVDSAQISHDSQTIMI